MRSALTVGDCETGFLPAPVPYGVLVPEADGPLPLCVFLLGAGGTRDSLFDLRLRFDQWWNAGTAPPMIVAIPNGGLDYYLEDSAGARRWDSFLADEFVPHLRSNHPASDVCVVVGISGGGYGALKLGFARADVFSAVAVMQPMLEPGWRESDVGARNRLHHAAGGPAQLIGPARDASLWEANNPANRARANAGQIRSSGLAIYLEAADNDFLNAHDGAEFLHRALWDLDISHEYHVIRNADHGGPTMGPRLERMFGWFRDLWNPPRVEAAVEEAAAAWIAGGMKGKPAPGATTTEAFIRFMRTGFEPLRAKAAEADPTTKRRLGRI